MAKAFKCDICGQYRDGRPTIMEFKADLISSSNTVQKEEICGYCHAEINSILRDIGLRFKYLNAYVDDEEFEE